MLHYHLKKNTTLAVSELCDKQCTSSCGAALTWETTRLMSSRIKSINDIFAGKEKEVFLVVE